MEEVEEQWRYLVNGDIIEADDRYGGIHDNECRIGTSSSHDIGKEYDDDVYISMMRKVIIHQDNREISVINSNAGWRLA